MTLELPPLDADTRALLEAERLRPDPPAHMRDGVRRKLVAAAIGLGIAAPGAAQAATGIVATAKAALFGHPVAVALTTAAVGTVLAVGISATRPSHSPPRTTVTAPIAAPREAPRAVATTPSAPPVAAPAPNPASRMRASARARPVASSTPEIKPAIAPPASPATDPALTVERTMLERARQALATGRPDEALQIATMHQRRFPRGRLAEQRERLAVESLLRTGDRGAALRRFEAFAQSFPESLMLPDLRAALREGR